MTPGQRQALQEVLEAMALEPVIDKQTISDYLRAHPQFTEEILNLVRELARPVRELETTLDAADSQLHRDALERFAAGSVSESDPLSAMTVEQQRSLASFLGIPRQVITGLRERRVIASSVSEGFVGRLAEGLYSTPIIIRKALEIPPGFSSGRAYKSDAKPDSQQQVTFEQLLIDAQVPADKRADLLAEED